MHCGVRDESQCSPEMRSAEDIDLPFDDESQCSREMRNNSGKFGDKSQCSGLMRKRKYWIYMRNGFCVVVCVKVVKQLIG